MSLYIGIIIFDITVIKYIAISIIFFWIKNLSYSVKYIFYSEIITE